MQKNVLITGGAGFLGVHLTRQFLKEKYIEGHYSKEYAVTIMDMAALDATDLIGKVKYIKGDIRKRADVRKAIKNQDFVVHAAAALPIVQSKKYIFSVNVNGTKNVLEESFREKVKRLVFISSTAVYGVPKTLPEKETDPLNPIGFYGESKVMGETLCRTYYQKGLSVNILRPKTFLGPERLGVFQLWFEAIFSGKPIFLLGNGKNRYQLLAVSDVTSAVSKALTSPVDGEVFNIGAESFGTWNTDLGAVIRYAKSKSTFAHLPVLPSQFLLFLLETLHLSPIAAWHYKTLPINSYVSIAKAKKLLKWVPKKSNQQLLLESYRWYEKHRNEVLGKVGTGHRVGWNFGILNIVRKFF